MGWSWGWAEIPCDTTHHIQAPLESWRTSCIQDLTAHVSLDGSFEQSQSLTRWCYKPTICFSWWFAGALLLKLLILTRKRRCGIECCIHISYGPYGRFLSKLLVWILCWSANLAKSEQRQNLPLLHNRWIPDDLLHLFCLCFMKIVDVWWKMNRFKHLQPAGLMQDSAAKIPFYLS